MQSNSKKMLEAMLLKQITQYQLMIGQNMQTKDAQKLFVYLMKPELWLEILYQLHLIEKLLEKEQSPIKRVRYEGMKEALLYILEKENEL